MINTSINNINNSGVGKLRLVLKFVFSFLLIGICVSGVYANSNYTENNEIITQDINKISGVVLDSQGNPVIGASVMVEGTMVGASTNVKGEFSLNAAPDAVLEVSFLGYEEQKVSVGSRTNITITLREASEMMEEVVVVGYGTQKKVHVTGAVSMVDSKVFESRPVQNATQALQGQIPGLSMNIGNSGGQLDSELNISIRGTGTIDGTSSSAPLVLIDGVEGNLNAINPQDIESVSVLKDAASSAIYGARAAFGVILVTTKSGRAGRTNVNYSGNVRFSDPLQVPKMMDSYMFAQYFNEAAANDGQSPIFTAEMLQRIKDYQDGKIDYTTTLDPNDNKWYRYDKSNANTNWFKEFYKSWVASHEHSLSVSGGNEKVTYFVSGNFMDQNGLIRFGDDKFNRYSLNGKMSFYITDWLKLNYNNKWIREDYDRPTYLDGLFYHNIARRWPTIPVYDPNGYFIEGNEVEQLANGGKRKRRKDYIYQSLQLVFEPIKDWKIYAEGNYNTMDDNTHESILPVYGYDGDGNRYAFSWSDGRKPGFSNVTERNFKEDRMTVNLYSDYFKQYASGHYFKVMGGFNAELLKNRYIRGSKDELISQDVPWFDAATENAVVGGGKNQWATAGFFARVNYNYKERYMFEANVRRDGASRFVGSKQWGTFPSFSAGWNIAREDFFENARQYVNLLKLRGSWGQLGNMRAAGEGNWYPFYQSMTTSNTGAWMIDGKQSNIASVPGLISRELTWEKVQSWDIGIDFGMFNNRLTGTFGYFQRKTKDMVGPAPELSSLLGTAVPRVNNSNMESKGFELELSWRDRVGEFSYGARVTLADAKQKILKYPNEAYSLSSPYKGQRYNEIWGYKTIGIAKTQAEMDAHLAKVDQSVLGSNWGAGDIMYADLDNDGKITTGKGTLDDPGDRVVIGNSTPRYEYGITLDAAWKGIDFRVFFQGVGKRDYWLGDHYFWGAHGGMWASAGFRNHWDFFRPEGHELGANVNGYYPRPYHDNNNGNKNKQVQSRYLQDASYFRMKNIQIGYTLPRHICEKIGMQSIRVYVSGDNLWTRSDISGVFDPELLGGSWGQGKIYPLTKVISVGININF